MPRKSRARSQGQGKLAPDYTKARRHLVGADPTLAALMRRVGPCRLGHGISGDPFTALINAIASQQLSVKAADTIFRRVCALFPPDAVPNPGGLANISDDELRAAGLSRPKIRYLRDLAGHVQDGRLDFPSLASLDDDEALARLTAVKGIGVWTAEIFLMFRLGRLDILPADDLGLLRATQQVYGLRTRPTPKRLRRMGEAWQPYRSVAAWYLWASLAI